MTKRNGQPQRQSASRFSEKTKHHACKFLIDFFIVFLVHLVFALVER